MQVRFKEFDKKNNEYKLLTCFNVDDYNEIFKLLTFMKENECQYAIEHNTEDICESLSCGYYNVIDVSLNIPTISGDIIPHISVEVERCY